MRTQIQRVAAAFYERPKTMLMVALETEIRRANVCRYVATLRQHDNIYFVGKGICPISKSRAGFYTTNPDLRKE
jgi:hypothetical protein